MAKDDSLLPIAGRYLTDNLKTLYSSSIQQLIADLGREVTLTLPPSTSGCPNCEFLSVAGRSIGRYDSSNPYVGKPYNIPFPDGYKCPVCFPAGTVVSTENGYSLIENIFNKNENVIDIDGDIRNVHSEFCRKYSGDFVKLEIDGFTHNFKCTANHKLHIVRNGLRKTVKAINIKKTDCVVMPIRQFNKENISAWDINWQEYSKKRFHSRVIDNIKNLLNAGFKIVDIVGLTGINRQSIRKISHGDHQCFAVPQQFHTAYLMY